MSKASCGLIIAAGKQKRFNLDIPKALVNIDGRTLLDINYNILKSVCDNVYVVCSYDNEKFFDDLNYQKIVIDSGLGSGDAIYKALSKLNINSGSVFISWGDSLLNRELCEVVLSNYRNNTLIPCLYENNPYVQIVPRDRHVSVLFSKYGEKITSGYHDMSLFLCPISTLNRYLNFYIKEFYNIENNIYNSKHGNEFEFLDIFNDTLITADILEINKNLKTYSFNTIEELQSILRR